MSIPTAYTVTLLAGAGTSHTLTTLGSFATLDAAQAGAFTAMAARGLTLAPTDSVAARPQRNGRYVYRHSYRLAANAIPATLPLDATNTHWYRLPAPDLLNTP